MIKAQLISFSLLFLAASCGGPGELGTEEDSIIPIDDDGGGGGGGGGGPFCPPDDDAADNWECARSVRNVGTRVVTAGDQDWFYFSHYKTQQVAFGTGFGTAVPSCGFFKLVGDQLQFIATATGCTFHDTLIKDQIYYIRVGATASTAGTYLHWISIPHEGDPNGGIRIPCGNGCEVFQQ
jgi:hypothetical protein